MLAAEGTAGVAEAAPWARGEGDPVIESEVAIVGAGAAGLSLAYRLAHTGPGRAAPTVTLIEAPPGPRRPPERT
ncbi:lycopene cyclase family protein, partial [Streptomyces sp. NPDC058461]|uniref:lycopene cyclase family protein n=1 Tax=Streptomyces sp. NPDC058461 TaxID=3346509 RepID=UPI003649C103